MNKLYIGADPGISGGIAIVDGRTGELLFAMNTPTMSVQGAGKKRKNVVHASMLFSELTERLNSEGVCHDAVDITVEKVHAMPNQGVSSSFTFGENYGALLAVLDILAWKCPFNTSLGLITPSIWKKYFEIAKKDLTVTERKGIAIDKATEIFGEENKQKYWSRKKDDGVAEAALLARYSYEMDNAHKRKN